MIMYIDLKIEMSYYRIGDRVRLIQAPPENDDVAAGDEGTIVNFISAHIYRIKLDNEQSVDLNARQFEKAR